MEYTKERAMEWLNKHWQGEKACPVCQSNNWTIGDLIGVTLTFTKNTINLGAPLYPVFLATCGTCGYTLFFNAIVAGFTFEQAITDEKKKES